MMRIRTSSWCAIGIIAGLSAVFIVPGRVSACTPSPKSAPASIALHAVMADLVVVGSVTDVSDDYHPIWAITAVIRVEDNIKGAEEEADLSAVRFGNGGGDCLSVARPGYERLFFLERRTEFGSEHLSAHYTYPYDASLPATEDIVNAARLGVEHGSKIHLPSVACVR